MRNNRTAGHNFEREIVKELKALLPIFNKAVTSRLESKAMDDKKVDLCHTPGYYFQLKNTQAKLDSHEILTSMPKEPGFVNVIIHRKTKKKTTKFVTQGDYVIMKKTDFYNILKKLNPPEGLQQVLSS